jgi:DNA ligase 1
MNVDLMNRVEAASGRLEKEALLAQETDTRFLRWALDPGITFGVTVDTDDVLLRWAEPRHRMVVSRYFWDEIDVLCQKLSRRELTGNLAQQSVTDSLLTAPTRGDCLWACRVLNRDLRCGVQLRTAIKLFPDLCEPHAVMLAQEYDPEKHDVAGWLVQRKLDGLRCTFVDGVAYSRNGRVIETVGHVRDELMQFGDYVFDGELMGDTEFNADSGRARRKGTGPDLGLRYHVFDCMPLDHWLARRSDTTVERACELTELLRGAELRYVVPVEWELLPSTVTFQELSDRFRDLYVAQGYEGCMLKHPGAPYEWKRSRALLKFKPFLDADGTIIGFQEGKGKHRGKLGAIFAEFDGVVTRVGSGFTDVQREEMWGPHNHAYVGRTVEVKYQNKTPDGKLRFPVFQRIRWDK